MPKAKQITIWVENTPGQLAKIGKALADAKVNVTAFTAYPSGEGNPIRVLVTSPAKASKAIQELGLRVSEEEVLRLTLADKPGKLGAVGERLAHANIQVEYAYATVATGARKADVILAVSDLPGAAKALRGL